MVESTEPTEGSCEKSLGAEIHTARSQEARREAVRDGLPHGLHEALSLLVPRQGHRLGGVDISRAQLRLQEITGFTNEGEQWMKALSPRLLGL